MWRYFGHPCFRAADFKPSSTRQFGICARCNHHADKCLVITTSPRVVRQVPLPYGFSFLDLREIGRSVGERLVVDHARLEVLCQRLPAKYTPATPATKSSRKSRETPPGWIIARWTNCSSPR